MHAPAKKCRERWCKRNGGQVFSCQRSFPKLLVPSSFLELPDFQRLRVATTVTSECAVSSRRQVCITSVSRWASRYQTKGMRIQCRGVGGVWCCCVRACVSPTTGSGQSLTAMGLQRARRQHGNEKRCRCATSSVSQAGLAPVSRQVGGGISLKRARTYDQPDGESLAQTSRLGRQTAVCVKIRRLAVGVVVVESKRRDAVATDGSRRWYGTGAVSTRGGVQTAAVRPGQGGDYWRANEGCARESGRVRACARSEALRYARAIGIRIGGPLAGGRYHHVIESRHSTVA